MEFLTEFLVETRLQSESYERLIGFLVFLVKKWPKNKVINALIR